MNLSRPFIRRPVASGLIAVALVLVGVLAYGLLPVSPLPQVDFPTIRVSASLPGASPDTMAASVSAPLERALGGIAGVSGIYSDSRQGSTSITLEFALGRDINGAARDVQAAINAARGQLPSGMPGNPTFKKSNPSQAPIMALALNSPNLAPGALYDLAVTVLAQKIAQINGVGEVSVGGSSLPAVRVQLNPHALSHYGIALDEVRRAISATNSVRPRGVVEAGERQWEVQLSGQLRHASQYQDLVIRYRDGAPVRLGDVATITDSIEDRYSSGFHNARPAVTLLISRQPGANIIATIDAITAQLPALRALVPVDAGLDVVMDRSPGIRGTLRESQKTLAIASGLVMLVVFLFLGSARAALIPCLAIPVSLIGTLAIMYLYGFSLNNLSLMALIVAAGMRHFNVLADEVTQLINYSLAFIASLTLGSGFLHVIKLALGRRRPRDDMEMGLYGFMPLAFNPDYNSFPSGHALTICCVAVIFTCVWPMAWPIWFGIAALLAVTRALLTAMDQPLGRAVGNALEVAESIECLKGRGPADTMEVTYALAEQMLVLAGVARTATEARGALAQSISSGAALEKFRAMINAQGGDSRVIDEPVRLPQAKFKVALTATRAGFVQEVDAMGVALAALRLGAGRVKAADGVDHAVGFSELVKVGEPVAAGATLGVIHANDADALAAAKVMLAQAIRVGEVAGTPPALIDEVIG